MEQTIIKQSMRGGMPLPDRIANAPQLWFGLELYYEAFWELSTCRTSGWSVGPIPWLAISEYARVFQFSDRQSDNLFKYVRELDQAYLNFHSPKKAPWQRHVGSDNSRSAWPSSAKG